MLLIAVALIHTWLKTIFFKILNTFNHEKKKHLVFVENTPIKSLAAHYEFNVISFIEMTFDITDSHSSKLQMNTHWIMAETEKVMFYISFLGNSHRL